MSVSIGRELPERVRALLGEQDEAKRVGIVVTLVTVDEKGFPHVALLSPGEILVVSSTSLRLALYAEGTTLRNATERRKLTLALVEPDLCCYVKGSATTTDTTLPPEPLMPFFARRVDVEVEDVLLDSELGASIRTGARYSRSAALEDELSYWHRVHKALRGS